MKEVFVVELVDVMVDFRAYSWAFDPHFTGRSSFYRKKPEIFFI